MVSVSCWNPDRNTYLDQSGPRQRTLHGARDWAARRSTEITSLLGGGEAWLFLKLSLVGRLNKSAGGGQSVERAGSRASVATVAFKIWSHLGSLSPRRTNMEKEGNQAL